MTLPTPPELAGRHALVEIFAARRKVVQAITFPSEAGAPARVTVAGFPSGPEPIVVSAVAKLPPPERVESIDLGREVSPGVSEIPRAVADSLGYPLPGRALHASVAAEL